MIQWYKCFLETIEKKTNYKSLKQWGLISLLTEMNHFTATLQWVIQVSIITNVMNSDIPLLSKDAMKRAMTCLNFSNDSVNMLEGKVPMKWTSSGHYNIPISWNLSNSSKFNEIFLIQEITTKNSSEKVKTATKLHKQFSHPHSKKLYHLVRKPILLTISSIRHRFID